MRLSAIMSYINIPQYKKMSMYILFLSIIPIYTLQSCKLFYFKMITSHVDVRKIICCCQIYCQLYHVDEFKYMLLLLFYII